MPMFNADVSGVYAPKFEAASLADAIAYANANFLAEFGAPPVFNDRNVCLGVNGKWVPAWLVEWSEIDAEWAKPLAEAQKAKRAAVQAAYDALSNRSN